MMIRITIRIFLIIVLIMMIMNPASPVLLLPNVSSYHDDHPHRNNTDRTKMQVWYFSIHLSKGVGGPREMVSYLVIFGVWLWSVCNLNLYNLIWSLFCKKPNKQKAVSPPSAFFAFPPVLPFLASHTHQTFSMHFPTDNIHHIIKEAWGGVYYKFTVTRHLLRTWQ